MIEINVWKRIKVNAELYFLDLPLFRKPNGSYYCFEKSYRAGVVEMRFLTLTHDQLVIGTPTTKKPMSIHGIIAMIFTTKNLPSLEG